MPKHNRTRRTTDAKTHGANVTIDFALYTHQLIVANKTIRNPILVLIHTQVWSQLDTQLQNKLLHGGSSNFLVCKRTAHGKALSTPRLDYKARGKTGDIRLFGDRLNTRVDDMQAFELSQVGNHSARSGY